MNRKHFFAACVALSSLVCASPLTAEESVVAPPKLVAPVEVPEGTGVELSAQTDKPKYQTGEPITLIVRLTNVTKEELSSTRSHRPVRLGLNAVEVISPNGQKAPLTLLGKKTFVPLIVEMLGDITLSGYARDRRTSIKLAPNQALENTFQINKLYDMSLPGEYKIVAKKQVHRGRNTFQILPVLSDPVPHYPVSPDPSPSSNRVTITYVPLSSNTVTVTVEDTPSMTNLLTQSVNEVVLTNPKQASAKQSARPVHLPSLEMEMKIEEARKIAGKQIKDLDLGTLSQGTLAPYYGSRNSVIAAGIVVIFTVDGTYRAAMEDKVVVMFPDDSKDAVKAKRVSVWLDQGLVGLTR